MTTKKLLSWKEIKPFAEDIFDNYGFEIYWARVAWDFLLKNEDKINDIKPSNEMVESVLWLLALYLLLFRFKQANDLENNDTLYELDEKVLLWGIENELSKYYFGEKSHKIIREKKFRERFFDDCYKRAEKYKKIVKRYFNNNLEQINAFFDGSYYIEHYTNYDKKHGDKNIEYDNKYDKYRCDMKTEWLHSSFLDNF